MNKVERFHKDDIDKKVCWIANLLCRACGNLAIHRIWDCYDGQPFYVKRCGYCGHESPSDTWKG